MRGHSPTLRSAFTFVSPALVLCAAGFLTTPSPVAAQISLGGISVGGGGVGVSLGGPSGIGAGIGGDGIGLGIGGPGGIGAGVGAGGVGIGIGGGSFNVGPGGIGAVGGIVGPGGSLGAGLGALGYGVGNYGPGGLNVSSRGVGFGGAQLLSRNADGTFTVNAGAVVGEKADLNLNLDRALAIVGSPTNPNLHVGDVVKAIDGVVVGSKQDVARILATHSPNDDVLLKVLGEDGVVRDVLARLGTTLSTPPLTGRPTSLVDPVLDLSRSPLGALLGLTLGRGLEVTGVDPTGAAAAAGLKAGDILLGLNGLAITSDDALAHALAALGTGNIAVLRDGRVIDVPLGSLRDADNVIAGAAATGGTGVDQALVGNADAGTGAGLGAALGKFPGTNDNAAALGTGGGLGAVDNNSPVGNAGAGTGAGVGALLGGLNYKNTTDNSAVGGGAGLGALGTETPVGDAGAGGAAGLGLLQSSLRSTLDGNGFTAAGTGGGLGTGLNNDTLGNVDGGAGAGLGALLGNLPTASQPGGFLALGTGGGAIADNTPIGDAGLGGGAGVGALLGGIGTPGGNAGGLTGAGAGGGLGTVLNNTPVGDVNAGTGLGVGALLAGKNFQGTPLNPAVGLGNGTGVGLNNAHLGDTQLGSYNAQLGAGVGALVGGVTQGRFPNGTVANAGGGVQLTASNTPLGDANISPTPSAAVAIGSGDNPGNVAAGGGGQGFGDGTSGSNPSRDGATTLGGGTSYGGGGVVVPGGSGNTGSTGDTTVGGGGGNAVEQGSGGIKIPGGGGTGGTGGGTPSPSGNNTLIGGTGGSPTNSGSGGIVIPGPASSDSGGGTGSGTGGNTLIGATGGNDSGTGSGGIVLPGGADGNTPTGGNTFIGGTGGGNAGTGTGGILIPGTGTASGPPTVIGGGGSNGGGGGTGGIFIPGTAGTPNIPATPTTPTTPTAPTTPGGNNNGTGGSFGSSGGAFTNAGYYPAGSGYPAFYSPFLGLYGDRGAAFLGVMFENDQLQIAHVCSHGPAAQAGIVRNDRIIAIDQQRFDNHAAFVEHMKTMTPLELVQVTLMRNDEPVSLAVELGALLPIDAVYGTDVDGILTESIADFSDADLKAQDSLGFLTVDAKKVIHVCPTDASWSGGIRPGDELVSINETTFQDRAALTKFVGKLKPAEPMNVIVRRDGAEKILTWGFEEGHADGEALQKIVRRAPPAVLGKDLRVARADAGSRAYQIGLRNGDVVQYVNGRKLTSLDDAAAVLRNASRTQPVHLVAMRNGKPKSFLWTPTAFEKAVDPRLAEKPQTEKTPTEKK